MNISTATAKLATDKLLIGKRFWNERTMKHLLSVFGPPKFARHDLYDFRQSFFGSVNVEESQSSSSGENVNGCAGVLTTRVDDLTDAKNRFIWRHVSIMRFKTRNVWDITLDNFRGHHWIYRWSCNGRDCQCILQNRVSQTRFLNDVPSLFLKISINSMSASVRREMYSLKLHAIHFFVWRHCYSRLLA